MVSKESANCLNCGIRFLKYLVHLQMISGTREWAVAEINCCLGCPHDCRYCYAQTAALKKGLITSVEQWAQSRIIDQAVKETQPHYQGRVMFPTAHDIVEENLAASTEVIGHLLAADNKVLIVSKPSVYCIDKICDRFYRHRHRILFRFTITARDYAVLSFWEPGAPDYPNRLASLKIAYQRGFETSISIEPILDISDLNEMIAELEPFVDHSIWIGKMNRIEERVAVDSDKMAEEVARIRSEQDDERIVNLYETLKGNRLIRWKESIKQVVGLPLPTESGLDQ